MQNIRALTETTEDRCPYAAWSCAVFCRARVALIVLAFILNTAELGGTKIGEECSHTQIKF